MIETDKIKLLRCYMHKHLLTVKEISCRMKVHYNTVSAYINNPCFAIDRRTEFWKEISKITGLDLSERDTFLPSYVVPTLRMHGNCVISGKVLRTIKKENIIAYLKVRYGMDCKIKIGTDSGAFIIEFVEYGKC